MATQERTREDALALIYRGPASCEGCSEAVAELLRAAPRDWHVHYVGPSERLHLTAEVLRQAVLYVQPGGADDLSRAYQQMKQHASALREFVASGGRYLGICMGGYLAGRTPGLQLLPGDTEQWIATRGASVKTSDDTLVRVRWRGSLRTMYFQDGPCFLLDRGATGVTVLATYTNSKVAALVASYGQGKVGVVGPHPEATANWYTDAHLVNPEGIQTDPGLDLLDTLMQDNA